MSKNTMTRLFAENLKVAPLSAREKIRKGLESQRLFTHSNSSNEAMIARSLNNEPKP